MTLKVEYHDGAFIPQEHCAIPEGAQGVVTIDAPSFQPPLVADPEQRKKLLAEAVEPMRQNPLPTNAPRFTREQLYDRGSGKDKAAAFVEWAKSHRPTEPLSDAAVSREAMYPDRD